MAARKLKFKPKPVVGGAVRRPREKEDIPELAIKGSQLDQEATHEDVVSQNDILKEETCKDDDCVFIKENDAKRIRLEQVDTSVLPSTDIEVKTFDLPVSCSQGLVSIDGSKDKISTNITSNETTSQSDDINIDKIVNLEPLVTQSSVSSLTTLVTPSCSQESKEEKLTINPINSSLIAETDSQSSSNILKKSIVDVKSTEKTEVTKPVSRFGRSKFKPVLGSSVSRKKMETNCNTINNNKELSLVRTETVIKCVKSEMNASSIVSEITKSFSALESEEAEAPLEIPTLTKENESTNKLSRFDSGNVDVKTNINELGSNDKVHVVKKTMQPANDSGSSDLSHLEQAESVQSNKLSENIANSETSNSNVQTASTSKVPISPLKLSSKMLVPKPCPNLLDTAVRRISFHGSDSEEESKRKILKHNKLGKKVKEEKDIKNSKRKLSQGSTYSKLGQEALEKFTQKFGKAGKLEPPDKSKLTMLDLIFYNPKSNPMSASTEQVGVKKKEDPPGVKKKEDKFEISSIVKETLAEQAVDDVEEGKAPAPAVPVPQLKVGPDGQIMLDPNSLVIETTEVKEKRAEMEKSEVIRDTGITRYNTYSKKKHTRKDWSAQETLQFYKALNTIGSDFTLMAKLFPKRSRHELKLKFKKEEKTNMKLVDLAMTAPTDFDFSSLEEEMRHENEEIARLEEEKRLAAEAARKARAIKKEAKEKSKGYPKMMKTKCKEIHHDAAFRNFEEEEIEKMKTCPGPKKTKRKKRVVKKKRPEILVVSSSDEEDIPLRIDLDSDEADLDESEMKLLNMIREKTRPGIRKGRRMKQTKKLEEYEEINETLKRKLEEIDSDLSDGYTPNGPGADMLFGSPMRDPLPSQEDEESQWSMEVTAASSVNETVLLSNVKDVKQLSRLSSLKGIIDLDQSFPAGAGTQEAMQESEHRSGSVLNRNLITESIQIIDQLTSNEQLNVNSQNITPDNTNANREQSELPQESIENQIPLPSFGSVSSRPPVVYQSRCSPDRCDKNNSKLYEKSVSLTISQDTDEHSNHIKDISLPYSTNNAEECILGE